jgi:hypothetical protein
MKRSELDKLRHQAEVLQRKIVAYERVRKEINDLAFKLINDVYALEALNAIDRTIFNQLQFMKHGLKKLEQKLKESA